MVRSDFGDFPAMGQAMLKERVREVYAIAALKEIDTTAVFGKTTVQTVEHPFIELYNLVVHPVDTSQAIPKGLWTLWKDVETETKAERSQYEDTATEAFLTVSRYKRRYAAQLGIDVYTSNPAVQRELNRIGWAGALGNWTPAVVTLPLSGPALVGAKIAGEGYTLEDLLTEEEPDILWRQNDELLKQMGVSRQLRTLFLNNPVYSPRHHTIITHALSSINGLEGANRFIELANEARSEIDAFTFQQIAEMIAGFNLKQAPVLEILKLQDLPVAYAKDGTLLAAYPADRLRWTPYSASLARQLSANPFKAISVQKTEVWITGSLSPRMKQELAKLNINFMENISAY